jgi:ligand-binding SRPBCC domain-containing protein
MDLRLLLKIKSLKETIKWLFMVSFPIANFQQLNIIDCWLDGPFPGKFWLVIHKTNFYSEKDLTIFLSDSTEIWMQEAIFFTFINTFDS